MSLQPGTPRGNSGSANTYWPGWNDWQNKAQPGKKKGIAGKTRGITASNKRGSKGGGAIISLAKKTGNYTNWWISKGKKK